MIHPGVTLSLFTVFAPALAGAWDDFGRVQFAQVTLHQRVVIRVTTTAPAPVSAPRPITWKEKKGPKCIAVADLGGAMVSGDGAIDLALTGNRRIRAHLGGECRPMDYYSRFYLKPAADGRVCANRDVLSMRSGLTCEIKAFRTLVPRK